MSVTGLFHKLLLLLPPDVAHCIGVIALKLYQKIFPFKKRKPFNTFSLSPINASFSNRIGLAAGFDKNAEIFAGLSQLGFGFVEVGTVTPLPQPGNPKPRLWRVPEEELVNYMGFNSVGVEDFKKNIQRLRKRCFIPLFVNIGKNKATPQERAIEDYRLLFQQLESVADAFVVNLSSPNTPGLRDLQSTAFLSAIAKIAPSKPVCIKLSPDLENVELENLLQQIAKEEKLSGVVLTNTSIQLRQKRTSLQNGGLSGNHLFARSIECVKMARRIIRKNQLLIGVGGVNSLERAVQMREAGADLVEIYTSFVYQGPAIVRALSKLPN